MITLNEKNIAQMREQINVLLDVLFTDTGYNFGRKLFVENKQDNVFYDKSLQEMLDIKEEFKEVITSRQSKIDEMDSEQLNYVNELSQKLPPGSLLTLDLIITIASVQFNVYLEKYFNDPEYEEKIEYEYEILNYGAHLFQNLRKVIINEIPPVDEKTLAWFNEIIKQLQVILDFLNED